MSCLRKKVNGTGVFCSYVSSIPAKDNFLKAFVHLKKKPLSGDRGFLLKQKGLVIDNDQFIYCCAVHC